MVKKGAKSRNRSSSCEVEESITKNRFESPVPVAPVHVTSKHYTLDGDFSGSMPRLKEGLDSLHSPFFLHSSDHPGLSIVSHILDGTNYNNWSIAMRVSLDAKNKLSFVDGSLPRPEDDDPIFKVWSRCNSLVKSWIMNVVSKEIYDSILYYQDAVEMWEDLLRRFRVSNLPRRYQLEQAVMTLKQGDMTLSAYYTKKKTLWEQLSNTKMSSVKKCDCNHVKELTEEAETSRVIQFLMGLNDEFNNIRGQILNMKPRPNLTEMYNILDQDESQRLVGLAGKHVNIAPSAFQMQKSVGDHTLFIRVIGSSFLAVLVYVDDIVIASNDDEAVMELKAHLSSCFKLRDLGRLQYFLGLEIARSAAGISLGQRKYVLDLLSDTGFLACKPSAVPMDPNLKLQIDKGTRIEDVELYKRLVGKLMYLSITRPDISYAVNTLCQFSASPTDVHLQAVHKVLRYLKGTVGQGLFYPADKKFDLRGFSDSDWAACADTRRSVTGWCMYVGDSLVSWKSKKQTMVSRSTAEAEYRVMALATCELMWLSRLMADLQVPLTTPAYLYCDNTTALHIANNPVFHERTKHIDIDCHCVREQLENGFLKTSHVRSEHQLADILTKSLHPGPFRTLIGKMGIHNIFELPS